jgi:hypothetical protein
MMKQNLLTAQDIKNLPALYAQENEKEPMAWVHLFAGRNMNWYLMEYDSEDNLAFGLCDLGMGYPELGYVSLDELAEGGFVQRDNYFTPTLLSKIKKEVFA